MPTSSDREHLISLLVSCRRRLASLLESADVFGMVLNRGRLVSRDMELTRNEVLGAINDLTGVMSDGGPWAELGASRNWGNEHSGDDNFAMVEFSKFVGGLLEVITELVMMLPDDNELQAKRRVTRKQDPEVLDELVSVTGDFFETIGYLLKVTAELVMTLPDHNELQAKRRVTRRQDPEILDKSRLVIGKFFSAIESLLIVIEDLIELTLDDGELWPQHRATRKQNNRTSDNNRLTMGEFFSAIENLIIVTENLIKITTSNTDIQIKRPASRMQDDSKPLKEKWREYDDVPANLWLIALRSLFMNNILVGAENKFINNPKHNKNLVVQYTESDILTNVDGYLISDGRNACLKLRSTLDVEEKERGRKVLEERLERDEGIAFYLWTVDESLPSSGTR